MSSIFSDDALHPGRDPNDSSWQILRQPHDWASATFRDTVYDPLRKVVELAPRALAPGAAGPLDTIASDGTIYRCDPDRDLVLRRGPCDVDFVPLPHFGGRGTTTGRLRRPLGIAVDDRRLLYVADTDNHRVQVVQSDGAVEIVLGCANAWGEPVAGIDGGAMTEPVSVAISPLAIYIADRGGHRVHVFDRAFRWLRSFAATPRPVPVGFVATPIAVAVDAAGELLLADAGWPLLMRFAGNGSQLVDLPYSDPAVPASLACLAVLARFATSGDVVVGPIDGQIESLAWHRVIVDAVIPAGATIEVQTYANDDGATPVPVPWAPAAPIAMPDLGGAHDGPLERPVLSDVGRWQRARHGEYLRASPVVATYAGDGPNGTTLISLAGDGLARIRAGDLIELAAAAPSISIDRVFVASIPMRTVKLSAAGTMAVFGAGTAIVLLERSGVEPFSGPRTLVTLGGTDAIDLSAVVPDGTLAEVSVPHAVAALWRSGDVITIGTATVLVDDVRATPVTVTLATLPGGDYRNSTIRIVESPGRLFVADVTGLDAYVPPDEPIEIDGLTTGSAWSVPAAIHWVEPDLGAVWLAPGATIAWADWEDFTTAPGAATDRGRYLWLRLHLTGAVAHPDDAAATATPTIRSVRLLRPRLSYLRYLPATFSRRDGDDPTGSLFLERMLGIFERKLTTIESRYESVSRQLDPFAADPEWLRFIATWFDLYLDPSMPLARRRLLVAEAHKLYAIRGTPEGIRRYIEIVTGESPQILEGFQVRPTSGLVLGSSAVLGCAALGGIDEATATSTAFLDRYAHRFTIYVFVLDPCQRDQIQASVELLIDSIKPAHTLVDLQFVGPDARVDQSMVGVDFVLGDGRVQPRALGDPYPVLGRDPVLSPNAG